MSTAKSQILIWNKEAETMPREKLEKLQCQHLRETLEIWAKVKVSEPHKIQRSEGKAKRIIDRRDLGM